MPMLLLVLHGIRLGSIGNITKVNGYSVSIPQIANRYLPEIYTIGTRTLHSTNYQDFIIFATHDLRSDVTHSHIPPCDVSIDLH